MKLSIITINLNNKIGLERTIQSVINQSYKNFEYIIIDGGSTDGSIEIIKQYAKNIKYWISEPDSGIYNAMNKGILIARGEYCLFLNGGDELESELTVENILYHDLSCDIIYGNVMFIHENSVELYSLSAMNQKKLFSRTIPHPATLFKKELFIKYGLYDESFKIAADYDFILRTIVRNHVNFAFVNICFSKFYTDGISNREIKIREYEKKVAIKNNYSIIKRIYYNITTTNFSLIFLELLKRIKMRIYYLLKRK